MHFLKYLSRQKVAPHWAKHFNVLFLEKCWCLVCFFIFWKLFKKNKRPLRLHNVKKKVSGRITWVFVINSLILFYFCGTWNVRKMIMNEKWRKNDLQAFLYQLWLKFNSPNFYWKKPNNQCLMVLATQSKLKSFWCWFFHLFSFISQVILLWRHWTATWPKNENVNFLAKWTEEGGFLSKRDQRSGVLMWDWLTEKEGKNQFSLFSCT